MVKQKNQIYSIRGKLVSAVAMLLVAVIMVVSSTYAWFTLSTAPEVVGIHTAVGANGALEMMLYTGTPSEKTTTTSAANQMEINTMWGNLVNLKDNSYGLDKIVLLPSVLNALTADGALANAPLKTPEYGSDGRVTQLVEKTMFGTYSDGSFYESNGTGVRAVGVASGMTDRELAYRNALAAAGAAQSAAKRAAINSLSSKGGILANIVAKKAMSDDAKFTLQDVNNLLSIISTLNTPFASIEEAYAQYIIAYAASSAVQGDKDAAYTTVTDKWEDANGNLATFITSLENLSVEGVSIAVPDAVKTAAEKVASSKSSIAEAEELLADLAEEARGDDVGYTWGEIAAAVYNIADIDNMKLNGYKPTEVKEHMSDLVAAMSSTGLVLTVATDGGVYADIADHCGDYEASIIIEELTYGGISLNNVAAKMKTESTVKPAYLDAVNGVSIDKAPNATTGTGGGTGDAKKLPFSEFYGYVIDLAFRTNAANSNLLLQADGVDRIYDDNEDTTAETWGHGSTMTFASTSPDFSDDQVKALMACIRIVFFETGSKKVLAYAALDVENATLDADGWTAKMYLYYTEVEATEYTYTSDDATKTVYLYDGKYYTDTTLKTEDTAAATATGLAVVKDGENDKVVKCTGMFKRAADDMAITSLPQNAQVNVSTLVYLDGNTITNKEVSAVGTQSMTGTMNLQFASSAELVPMEYGDLHTAGDTTAEPSNP